LSFLELFSTPATYLDLYTFAVTGNVLGIKVYEIQYMSNVLLPSRVLTVCIVQPERNWQFVILTVSSLTP